MTSGKADGSRNQAGDYSIESIEASEAKWDARANSQQQKAGRFALAATCLGPAAVLLLALQVVIFHRESPYAWLLISSELALLAIVLAIGYTGIGPNPKEWAKARIRAEILRREKFLLKNRIGPYLGLENPGSEIHRRLNMIDMEEIDPVKLLPLSDAQGHWRDHLEDSRHAPLAESDLIDKIRDYATNRIEDQLKFYRSRTHRNHRRNEVLESSAKAALLLALIFSVVHLLFVVMPYPTDDSRFAGWEKVITIVSLSLPPFIATIAGWQSFYQPLRLKLSYQSQAEALTLLANELSRLEDKVSSGKEPRDAASGARYFREFKRIVLRAEEVMANEQIQWWMLINSWTPST